MKTIDLDAHRDKGKGRAPEWDAARRVLRDAAPPDRVEAELLRAFAQRHRKQPWYRRWSLEAVTPWAGIGAAGFALALAVAALQPAGPLPPVRPDRILAVADDGFVALVPAERMAVAAQPQLKEADLPRQALVQLGIPIANDAPNELIHTELLVAATGEPLAIRLAVN
jgi:hypothetical protein